MAFDFSQDHFSLLGLPHTFVLDDAALEAAYRGLQSQYHPDRAASLPDADKRQALQAATRVNEAFQILKSPLSRGRYLLKLAGVDTQEETNTAMPVAFLMQQMEWRESVVEARANQDMAVLDQLAQDLRGERLGLEASLGRCLDEQHDYIGAALIVRKLRFLEKLDQAIGDAIEVLLD
ncbi:Fe-S protein assembly co-chaperone HscB [Chitinimonas sp. BJB300]|uniref:Fe-S protein assembly co-chaperone HscB n=1 Tax=Chitinimonas sp. BJB300 TaxID=1559339 RepID=UPI000C0E51CA|nr:Fe-S protein assembly co-chaperone HscB [Chitinimonas sp. BJB300]PHV11639.1 Fe-S protein assembly co-chaperone HscB [Chitinimonas sp. BJB300]TSJ85595.1 Fe-S protein assembly co-chaperone HscB [Chitinimonas sp. BJB300]